MSETRWTPGEWEPVRNAQTGAYAIMVGASPRVAYVHKNDEHTSANAHLIAAAPDLYEALKPLAFCDDRQPPYGVELEDWQAAVFAARAALAKARGVCSE